jgi:disulfide oxidoreductase YuzD
MDIKIEVYGGMNVGGGGCSCACAGCSPVDVKAEYEAVKKALLDKFGEKDLSLEFIDMDKANPSDFPEIEKVIQAGYSFPVTVVNGSPRLAGGISLDSIAKIIMELQDIQ